MEIKELVSIKLAEFIFLLLSILIEGSLILLIWNGIIVKLFFFPYINYIQGLGIASLIWIVKDGILKFITKKEND